MPRTYAKGRKRRFQGNQYTLTQMRRAEVTPESSSDQSQEHFSSSSTESSPANSDTDSELSSDKLESKTTSSPYKSGVKIW